MTASFHGGASEADRIAEDHADRRRGPFRTMTLLHGGQPFLRRFSLECRWFGIYIHHIEAPDPGKDVHDHPWPFITLVLSGGYSDVQAETRKAHRYVAGGVWHWGRGSIHYVPLTIAHRIIDVEPDTWTLVVRGRKQRDWGFYPPSGWQSQSRYDYETRRPVEVRS